MRCIAIDLGASSGRVAIGEITSQKISFEVIHRFKNKPVMHSNGMLIWDLLRIKDEIEFGLGKVKNPDEIVSIGVDSWAVDYQLFAKDGSPIFPMYSYRDQRSYAPYKALTGVIGRKEIYQRTGIQFLPFNTLYQLASEGERLGEVGSFLMLPDVINHWLCGSTSTEVTNASTTQLLNPLNRKWDYELINLAHLPPEIFPRLHEPGTTLGKAIMIKNMQGAEVLAVGSHDTASAVFATPMSNPKTSIYISSGTWSLVGCELTEPILSDEAMAAGLTNELGLNNSVRLLKNVSGMWIISELLREWNSEKSIEAYISEAKGSELIGEFDPMHLDFSQPGNMVEKIRTHAKRNLDKSPQTKGEILNCVLHSLAKSYSQVIEDIKRITKNEFTTINIIGGGSSNDYLNQLTANYSRLPVVAGPVEATLLGNLGAQGIFQGEIENIESLRQLISDQLELKIFQPNN